ncbi:hypothetical protein BN132_266 [Cronobacter turicensis 564]|nr:hypothetical protein BN132_266 [Cronobacter turicensis 564]
MLSCTVTHIASAWFCSASAMAGRVFSGASPVPPRWAINCGLAQASVAVVNSSAASETRIMLFSLIPVIQRSSSHVDITAV